MRLTLVAALALCTGCGPIIAGVVLGTSGSSGSTNFTTTPPAPILTGPSSLDRATLVDGSGKPSATEVRVDYALVDATGDPLAVTAEWKRKSDTSFRAATAAASSDPVTGLASGADPGTSHHFVWAAGTDLAKAGLVEEDVVLRLQPARGSVSGTSHDVALRVGDTAPTSRSRPRAAPRGRSSSPP